MIVIMGISLYKTLPRDSMPPYTVRTATIVSDFPGASPERVELLVTKNIEEKVQEIPEVKEISSQSRTGLSVVTVTLKDNVEKNQLQKIWDRLRRKIEDLNSLPSEVSWNLKDDDVGVVYGIMLGLLSTDYSYAELNDYAETIRDDLIKLPNAAKVELGGVQEEQVFVKFDNARLAEYGLSVYKLRDIISATNILYSGGEVNLNEERITLEPTGNYNEINDLRKTIIPIGDKGDVVYLDYITTIEKGYKTPSKQLVRVNGKKAIALSISLKEGANIIQLGESIDEKISQYNKELPLGIDLIRLSSLDGYVQESINDFESNLIQAIVIVLVVMLIFLGLRTGLVVASLIPLVTIMTLMVMGVLGVGLNQVSLAALIMALGLMVDNAIVVSESILVKMEKGIPPFDAAVHSCRELSIPLLISTLTTSAAFLPFFLADSAMGEIMGPLFVVISIALLSSWLLALTVITLLTYYFIRIKKKESSHKPKRSMIGVLLTYYKKILPWVLRFRFVFVPGVFILFFGSMKCFSLIPFIFFPDSDRNLITIDVNLPLGTKIERTETIVLEIETFMKKALQVTEERPKGIIDWSSYIGQGPESYDLGYSADEPNSSYAHILANTSSGDDNQMIIDRLDEFCFRNFPDADIRVTRLAQGGGGTPIEVRISGALPDKLFEISESIKQTLHEIPGTKNIKDDWGPKIKKFVIDIDQAKAHNAGLTNQDIAVSLQTVLTGVKAGDFREEADSFPILMRSETSEQQTVQTLETTNILSQSTGNGVPLSQVARVVPQWDYAKIKRFDLERTITVSGYVKSGYTVKPIVDNLKTWLDKKTESWPPGYHYELGGDDENTKENMGAVINYLPLAGFIILLLLIIQFNSIRKTFMVLTTIPLGIIGVIVGLLLFRSYFGFMAFLGVISLAGIVINNAIVLIDRIEIELKEFNRTPQDAVIEASLQRFRPILLTTFTTTFGLIPLYLGGGVMWEPMAVAIMVGLLFATVITLLFIPSLYSILFSVKYKGYRFNY